MTSQIYGLAYYDSSTGQSVLIAQLTNSLGQLLPSGNAIIYTNALSGSGVQCDILYSHTISGLAQDLIIRAQLPPPSQWNLSVESTHLQLITEFFNSPTPQIQTIQLPDGDTDDQINFGVMQMIPGKAFLIGDTATAPLVRKHWTIIDGRTFLIEEIPLSQLSPLLQQLPPSSSGTSSLITFPVRNSTIAGVGSPSPGRENSPKNSRFEPLNRPSAAGLTSNQTRPPALPSPLPSLGRGEGQGEVRVHGEGRAVLPRRPDYSPLASSLASIGVHSRLTNSPSISRSPLQVGTARRAVHLPQSAFYLSTINSPSINHLANTPSLNSQPGLVLDYNLVTTQTNYTFAGDSTFFVTNTVYLSGTTVLEGGVVVKAATNSTVSINVLGAINCLTASYRPAVFTAQDDNTVGSTLPWSSGAPSGYYGNPALYVATNNLHNLLIKYANEAISVGNISSLPLSDLQLVNCNNGIISLSPGPTLSVYNALMYNVLTPFLGEPAFDVEQCTVDQCSNLMNIFAGLTVSNCVLANVTNWGPGTMSGDYNGLYNTPTNAPSFTHSYTNTTNPFQTVGAGAHYLASGCNFTNVGSSNINSSVLADIAQKTTQPPVVIGNTNGATTISTNLTLSPQVQRDTQSTPALGYHYDCLDYALGNLYLTNATMTVNAGTALGVFSATNYYGCAVNSGSQFICQGTPVNLNHIACYNTVQEQANANWIGPIFASIVGNFGGGSFTYIFCRFTDWSVLAQDVQHFYAETSATLANTFQDCQLHGGLLSGATKGITLTNCLLERVNFTDEAGAGLQNNLFWRGSVTHAGHASSGAIQDNVFDQTVISFGTFTTYTETNNAYNTLTNASYTNLTLLSVTNNGDVYLTNSSYQSGPLGNYYLPATSPLINAGSNTANQVGLYHYTTTTNQVPETNSLIDLGYHYIALNAWDLPLDTDGDGVPDYLADTNGDGIYEPGVDPQNWESPMVVAWGDNSSGQCNVPVGLSNVVAVAGGLGFSLALQSGGTVVAWGDNTYGQTNGAIGLSNVTAIAANYYAAAAINSGLPVLWGEYDSSPKTAATNFPAPLTNMIAISAGLQHGAGIVTNGTVAVWGVPGDYGNVATNLTGLANVAAAWTQNVGLFSNGVVTAWGCATCSGFTSDLADVPADLTNAGGAMAIAACDYHALALRTNLTVEAWGEDLDGEADVPTGLSNVIAIAAGINQSMALQSDGTVVTWGFDNGSPPQGLNQVTGIGSGGSHYLAIRSGVLTPLIFGEPADQATTNGGSVTFTAAGQGLASVAYQWQFNGVNIAGATSSALTLSGVGTGQVGTYDVVVSNGAGSITSSNATFGLIVPPVITALTQPPRQFAFYGSNETLSVTVLAPPAGAPALGYQWSFNGTNISGATSSSYSPNFGLGNGDNAEGTYSVVITNNVNAGTNVSWQVFGLFPGGVVAWGKDDFGQVDRPNTVLANVIGIAAGESNSVAVLENGQVIQWGYTNWAAIPANLTNAVEVSAGYSHMLALKSDTTVTNWGASGDQGNTVPSGLTGVKAISAGWFHNLALLTNGTITCWGTNNLTITNVPSNLTNVIAVAAGSQHSLALQSNGTVVAWGYNGSGQTNVPSTLSNVVAIAAGKFHSLALQSNGVVIAWGDNTYGQTNVPAGLTNVMAIAAGDGFSMALLNNATVTNWGDNTYGELTNGPQTLVNVKSIAAGGFQGLAAGFCNTLLYYPLDVSKDLLLVYNTNSIDSSNVCSYYLQHRPMVGNANVLGIGVPGILVTNGADQGNNISFTGVSNIFETVSPPVFTNYVLAQITNWLTINPTKHPQYIVMFHDIATRVDWSATNSTNYPFYSAPNPGVTYQLMTDIPGWQPLVSYIDMWNANDCIAYIGKIAAMASNNSPGSLIISANAATNSYANTNYYIDDSGEGPSSVFTAITNVLAQDGVAQAAISYIANTNDPGVYDTNDCTNTAFHLLSGTNVCGYACWGFHSSLGGDYQTNVTFHGNGGWYLIATEESFNGDRFYRGGGTFPKWFSTNAFVGTNYSYSNTPACTVVHVYEPGTPPYVGSFNSWQTGQIFIFCAQADPLSEKDLMIADPFIRR